MCIYTYIPMLYTYIYIYIYTHIERKISHARILAEQSRSRVKNYDIRQEDFREKPPDRNCDNFS